MNIKPIGNKVLIEVEDTEKTTQSGLIISVGQEDKKREYGTILAIGEGKDEKGQNLRDFGVKEGDRVLFNKYGGEFIDDLDNNTQYRVVKFSDVFAVIE